MIHVKGYLLKSWIFLVGWTFMLSWYRKALSNKLINPCKLYFHSKLYKNGIFHVKNCHSFLSFPKHWLLVLLRTASRLTRIYVLSQIRKTNIVYPCKPHFLEKVVFSRLFKSWRHCLCDIWSYIASRVSCQLLERNIRHLHFDLFIRPSFRYFLVCVITDEGCMLGSYNCIQGLLMKN